MKRVVLLSACFLMEACAPGEPDAAENAPADSVSLNTVINTAIPADQIASFERRGRAGDNEAADRLAQHYNQEGPLREEIRWFTVAAERGHCPSIASLRYHPALAADREATRRWNAALRENACTWRKVHEHSTGGALDSPAWDEE